MYITFEEYSELYSDITAEEFNIYAYDAERIAEKECTGVDGFNKLRNAMPEEDPDLKAIKRAIIGLTHEVAQMEKAKKAGGYIERADGTVQGKTLSSVSSGSESMSFGVTATVYELSASDLELRTRYLSTYAVEKLRGIYDKNGVNVLYMGVYPCI